MHIYKQQFGADSHMVIPNCEKILHFDQQNDNPTVWYLHSPNATGYEAMLYPTGATVPGSMMYIGTTSVLEGAIVLHCFALRMMRA